jgi:hypothetical protein
VSEGDAQGIGGVRSSREAAEANAEPRIARWGGFEGVRKNMETIRAARLFKDIF